METSYEECLGLTNVKYNATSCDTITCDYSRALVLERSLGCVSDASSYDSPRALYGSEGLN